MSELVLLIVAIVAVAFAAVMGAFAWRMARGERRRSQARVAALAADIHASPAAQASRPADEAPRYAEAGSRSEPVRRYPAPAPAQNRFDDLPLRDKRSGELRAPSFATTAPAATRSLAGIASGVCIVSAAAAVAIYLSRSPAAPPPARHASGAQRTAAPAEAPLELMSLGHDRFGDRLTVHGLVRNPASAPPTGAVTAVVFLFDRDGAFATSGRAPIERNSLEPGGESAFTVTIASAGDIGRYRVSFRTGDHVIPHVDRRRAPSGGRAGSSVEAADLSRAEAAGDR